MIYACGSSQIVEETLPALLKLKEQGLVRFIGFTGLPLKIYRSVLDRCAQGCSVPCASPRYVRVWAAQLICMCQLLLSVCLAAASPCINGQGSCLSCSLS